MEVTRAEREFPSLPRLENNTRDSACLREVTRFQLVASCMKESFCRHQTKKSWPVVGGVQELFYAQFIVFFRRKHNKKALKLNDWDWCWGGRGKIPVCNKCIPSSSLKVLGESFDESGEVAAIRKYWSGK